MGKRECLSKSKSHLYSYTFYKHVGEIRRNELLVGTKLYYLQVKVQTCVDSSRETYLDGSLCDFYEDNDLLSENVFNIFLLSALVLETLIQYLSLNLFSNVYFITIKTIINSQFLGNS